MPSTLAHLGAQTFASRAAFRQWDLRWIAPGLLAPDLPWIGVRLVRAAALAVDRHDLRLFAIVQSALLLLLLLHLGIDGLEGQRGGGGGSLVLGGAEPRRLPLGRPAVAVLREPATRAGKGVSLERVRLVLDDRGRARVRTWAHEVLVVEGVAPPAEPARVSLRGRFLDPRTLEVAAMHRHLPFLRDAASVLGLAGVALLLARGLRLASPSGRPGD